MRGEPLPPWTRIRTILAGILPLGLTAVAIPPAYVAMFSLFQPYDDEGYLLLSLQGHLEGHDLYEEVFSQYGPLYHLFNTSLFRVLGLDVTHDAGRLITLTLWLLAVLLGGLAVMLLTRSLLLGMASQILFYGSLSTLGNEPMHPGGLLGLLLATIVLVLATASRAPRFSATLLGALAGAILLVKVNVGAFALVSLGMSLVFVSPRLDGSLPLKTLAGAAFVATPFLVLARDLNIGWAASYATLVGIAALALVVVSFRRPPDRGQQPEALVWLGVGAAGIVLFVVTVTMATGTSLGALLDGAFLRPIRQPEAFSLPFAMPTWAPITAAGGLVGAGVALWRSGRPASSRLATPLAAAGRIAAGLLIWVAIGTTGHVPGSPLSLALPLAWVIAVPGRAAGLSPFVRTSLAALAILQGLHAYPVAGSQMAWSGLLLIPVGAVCIADGWGYLRAAAGASGIRRRAFVSGAVGVPVLSVTVWFVLWALLPSARNGFLAYDLGVQPRLPGASRLRIASSQARTYQRLAGTIQSRCSSFLSIPGLNSLYLFSGIEPPTYMNATAWMYLLDRPTQERVVERSESIDGLCTVRSRSLLAFWRQGRPVPPGPLVEFVSRDMQRIEQVDDYSIYVEKEPSAT